ncbi:MAG: 30S ribosomal protein S12 methylthiotransferase RimO, partial [Candidatus Neomarinimicrobiota bacterium]
TSLLVGYPGESEKDFWELLDFVEEFRFERLGVFTYSPEENTPAFELGDSIPPQEKENRRSLLMEKQWEIMEEKAAELKGKRLEVIVDDLEGNFYVGRSQWDAPEIDCIVKIPKEVELKIGEIYNIEVVGNDGIDIIGKVIKGNNCGGF